MTTDTSEKGLERTICTALTGSRCDPGGVDAETAAGPGDLRVAQGHDRQSQNPGSHRPHRLRQRPVRSKARRFARRADGYSAPPSSRAENKHARRPDVALFVNGLAKLISGELRLKDADKFIGRAV